MVGRFLGAFRTGRALESMGSRMPRRLDRHPLVAGNSRVWHSGRHVHRAYIGMAF